MNSSQTEQLQPQRSPRWISYLNVFKNGSNVVLALSMVVWFFLSYFNWISDSEFWPITLSGHWLEVGSNPSLIYKVFFHLPLTLIHYLNLDPASHIRVAKALFAGIAVGSLFLVYKILRFHLDAARASWSALMLLSCSLFFSNMGTIRSDMLASFIALFLFLKVQSLDRILWKKAVVLHLGFSVLLFFTTPKSIFLSAILALYLFFYLDRSVRLKFFNTIMIFLNLGVFAFVLTGQFEATKIIYDSVALAVVHGIRTQKVYADSFDRFNLPYFKGDIAFYLLIITSVFWQIFLAFRNRSLSPKLAPYILMFFSTVAFFFIQKPALPFFVCSLLPFLFLSSIPALQQLSLKSLIFLVVLVATLNFSIGSKFLYFFPNSPQLTAVEKMNQRMQECKSDYKVFDGMGVIPTRGHSILGLVVTDDELALKGSFHNMLAGDPDLVILTAKIAPMSFEINDWLLKGYVSVGKGYWLKKETYKSCQVSLNDLPESWHLFSYAAPGR